MPFFLHHRAAPPSPCLARIIAAPHRIAYANVAHHHLIITDYELDAVLAGLRLLARQVAARNVVFAEDDPIAEIWTCNGEHDGLAPPALLTLASRMPAPAGGNAAAVVDSTAAHQTGRRGPKGGA